MIKKKKTKKLKVIKEVAIKGVEKVIETPVFKKEPIALLHLDFGREDLNALCNKVNELINKFNA